MRVQVAADVARARRARAACRCAPASSSPLFSRSSGGIRRVAEGRRRPRPRRGMRSTLAALDLLDAPLRDLQPARRRPPRACATLCAFEPVKCCSRLPYDSGGTTRRSTCDAVVRDDATPWCRRGPSTSATQACSANPSSQRGRRLGRRDQVDVADRLGAGAAASPPRSALDAGGMLAQRGQQLLRQRRARGRAGAPSCAAPPPAAIAARICLPPSSRPCAGASRTGPSSRRARGRRGVTPERVVQLPRRLRADAGQVHDVDQPERVRASSLRRARDRAGLAQLGRPSRRSCRRRPAARSAGPARTARTADSRPSARSARPPCGRRARGRLTAPSSSYRSPSRSMMSAISPLRSATADRSRR